MTRVKLPDGTVVTSDGHHMTTTTSNPDGSISVETKTVETVTVPVSLLEALVRNHTERSA